MPNPNERTELSFSFKDLDPARAELVQKAVHDLARLGVVVHSLESDAAEPQAKESYGPLFSTHTTVNGDSITLVTKEHLLHNNLDSNQHIKTRTANTLIRAASNIAYDPNNGLIKGITYGDIVNPPVPSGVPLSATFAIPAADLLAIPDRIDGEGINVIGLGSSGKQYLYDYCSALQQSLNETEN